MRRGSPRQPVPLHRAADDGPDETRESLAKPPELFYVRRMVAPRN